MGYIKINLQSKLTDETGNIITASISRFESDLPMTRTYEMNFIFHALAMKGLVEIIQDFILDVAQLDNEQYLLG
jgi:hypothetical protein